MTGLGSSRMASMTSVHRANTSVYDASSRSISSRRSWPELNTGPSERSTTTRTVVVALEFAEQVSQLQQRLGRKRVPLRRVVQRKRHHALT